MAETGNNSRPLRPLLPRTAHSKTPPSPHNTQRKVSRAKTACENCRSNKSKCTGERPKCRPCLEHGRRCYYLAAASETRLQALKREYNLLQTRKSPYERLVELMKSLPERDASDILTRLRSGADIETLVSHVTNGDLLLQLSVAPETRFRYDFPYDKKMPATLLTVDNTYLHAPIYESATIYPASRTPDVLQHADTLSVSSTSSRLQNTTQETVYLKPFHAAEVIDSRLSDLDISSWTIVCNDNVLMRSILRRWLHCEYHFTAAFQLDLFLEDMMALREDFCSSLLVNVVLGYACVCNPQFTNRAEYWNPRTLTYQFIAEAKRLWELEAHVPRITTIQAGMLFNVFYNLSGLDEVGQAYRLHAINLIHTMGLFKSTTEESPRYRHGMAYTAWAFFNWETLVGFSFVFAPLLRDPPEWTLPDSLKESEWYGEIWFKYPTSDRLFPSYFARVFEARSRFRVIMNEACQVAYSESSEMTLEKANGIMWRLKRWFDGLQGPLLPRSIVMPGHLQLHMYYYHLILTLFKPFLDVETNQQPSPQQIVADATKYLQTLIRIYFLRHGYEAMDLFIVIPLMLAASDCVDAIDAIDGQMSDTELEALRSTLILVAMGLFTQRKNHYLANALFYVIRGRMRPAEIALFRGVANIDANELDGKVNMAQAVRSHWPVSVVKKKEELDSHILTNLVETYAHLSVEGERV